MPKSKSKRKSSKAQPKGPKEAAKMTEAQEDRKLDAACPMCILHGRKKPFTVPDVEMWGGLRILEDEGPLWDGSCTAIFARDAAEARAAEEKHGDNLMWCCGKSCAEDVPYIIEYGIGAR